MPGSRMITGRRIAMWVVSCSDRLVRVLAGCCALFWLVGSLSLGQSSVADQWTKPHCPSGQAQHSQQNHHCAWHCDGIDEQASDHQRGVLVDFDVGNVWNRPVPLQYAGGSHAQISPRGPPGLIS